MHARDGWWIADESGQAMGPLTREELMAEHRSGRFGAKALAWHVDVAEWKPLGPIAAQHGDRAPSIKSAGPASVQPRPEGAAKGNRNDRPKTPKPPKLPQAPAPAPVRNAATPAASKPPPMTRARQQADDEARARLASVVAKVDPRLAQRITAGGAPPPAVTNAAESGARVLVAIRRFLARAIDTWTLGLFAAAALFGWMARATAGSGDPVGIPEQGLLYILAVFALVPIEALMLSMFGTTPGKALLGLRVRDADGSNIGLPRAFARGIDVSWRGAGLGLPVLSFITLAVAMGRYAQKGRTHWDERLGIVVDTTPIGGGRWQAALVALILSIAMLGPIALGLAESIASGQASVPV